MTTKKLRVLGIRAIPAAYGGFETFAESLALYLQKKGWSISVYCQHEGDGPLATIIFDWKAHWHAARSKALCLTLGYNTAIKPQEYAVLIASAAPENCILEIVQAWSAKLRGKKLITLRKYQDSHEYQRAVKAAASEEVLFIGAVYEKAVVSALRYYAMFYLHGHQVGEHQSIIGRSAWCWKCDFSQR